jgi:hypothetical protein
MGIRFSCRRLGVFSLEMPARIPLWSEGVYRCYHPLSQNCLELPTTDIGCTLAQKDNLQIFVTIRDTQEREKIHNEC